MNPEHALAQIVLRSWPFGRGVSRIMNTFFPQRRFSEQIANIRTTDGVQLNVVTNDFIGKHLYLIGEYERSVLDVLVDLSRPGDVLLDIGANIGYISASFMHKVPSSRAIAIEPQAGIVGQLLKENLSQFDGRSQILQFAISNKSGRASFTVDAGNMGDGKITDTGDLEISTEPGDYLLRSFEKIDLVKFDVQGHELQALTSMQETLRRLSPRVIVFEDDGLQLKDISKFLTGFGYQVKAIRKTMLGYKIEEIASHSYDNYVALLEAS